METGYGAGGRGVGFRVPVGAGMFPSPRHPYRINCCKATPHILRRDARKVVSMKTKEFTDSLSFYKQRCYTEFI
jgi:hypothetical protein